MNEQQITNLQNARILYNKFSDDLEFMVLQGASFKFPFTINLVVNGLRLTGQITKEQLEVQDDGAADLS